jgi:hypothetical protein
LRKLFNLDWLALFLSGLTFTEAKKSFDLFFKCGRLRP